MFTWSDEWHNDSATLTRRHPITELEGIGIEFSEPEAFDIYEDVVDPRSGEIDVHKITEHFDEVGLLGTRMIGGVEAAGASYFQETRLKHHLCHIWFLPKDGGVWSFRLCSREGGNVVDPVLYDVLETVRWTTTDKVRKAIDGGPAPEPLGPAVEITPPDEWVFRWNDDESPHDSAVVVRQKIRTRMERMTINFYGPRIYKDIVGTVDPSTGNVDVDKFAEHFDRVKLLGRRMIGGFDAAGVSYFVEIGFESHACHDWLLPKDGGVWSFCLCSQERSDDIDPALYKSLETVRWTTTDKVRKEIKGGEG